MNEHKELVNVYNQFVNSVNIAIVYTDNPEQTRDRLYKAAKRRNLNWRFSVTDGAVIVKRLS